jgi:hypothetical protein
VLGPLRNVWASTVAGLIHVLFFAGESLLFGKLRKRFGVRSDEGFAAVQPFAFHDLSASVETNARLEPKP